MVFMNSWTVWLSFAGEGLFRYMEFSSTIHPSYCCLCWLWYFFVSRIILYSCGFVLGFCMYSVCLDMWVLVFQVSSDFGSFLLLFLCLHPLHVWFSISMLNFFWFNASQRLNFDMYIYEPYFWRVCLNWHVVYIVISLLLYKTSPGVGILDARIIGVWVHLRMWLLLW